jgi:UDP-glucose 4-epimerase
MPIAFVAGANGAIGRHVVAELKQRGWRVAGLGHGPRHWEAGRIDAWRTGEIDIAALDDLADDLGPPELILNLAGGASVGASVVDPAGDLQRTLPACVTLLAWAAAAAPEARQVHASSAAVYGDRHMVAIAETATPQPVSPYGFHKHLQEQAVRFWAAQNGSSAALVRLFSVYGPGLHKQLVHDLIIQLSGHPEQIILSGSGDACRDWIWIEDAARLMVDAADWANPSVPVFNGCTGRATSVRDMARMLIRASGGATAITFDGKDRPGDPLHLVGSTERLASAGYLSRVSLADGLGRLAHGVLAV